MKPNPGRRIFAGALGLLFAALVFIEFQPAQFAYAAPQAATWHVTTLADTNSSNPSCTNPCSLRQAIADAVNGDTVDFPSLSGTIPLSLGAITVTKNITVAGPGSANLAISGSNLNRVFEISSTVTISGLTIRDGNSGGTLGGGIYVGSSRFLTLTNSTVISNTGSDGGGIWNIGTLVVSNTVITGNLSGTGTAIENQGTLVLQNSSLISNTSATGAGATLYSPNFGTFATIISSSIISNTGTGIANEGPLTIVSSTIAYNSATGGITSGAGIYADHPLTITASTIHHNTTTASGGGISASSNATMTLNNVTISNNKALAVSAQGGGVLLGAIGNWNNVTIVGNTSDEGGGVYVSFGTQLNMQNTILALNTANFGPDCATNGTLNSQDYNLIGNAMNCTVGGSTTHNQSGDPKVTPLAWLGGPTQTHGLLSGSPALNKGNPATCLPTDQRGIVRPLPTSCDIGAFEGIASALYLPLILR